MKNNNILNTFANLNFTKKAVKIVNNSNDDFGIKILFGAAKSLFVASLLKETNKKILLITPNSEIFNDFVDDLNLLTNTENIFAMHKTKKSNAKLENDTFIAELISQVSQFNKYGNARHCEDLSKAIHSNKNGLPRYARKAANSKDATDYISTNNSAIAVATPDVFYAIIPNPDTVEKHFCNLKKNQIINVQQFTTQLSLNGFQKEQYVSRAGEYAVRGGIIDIFAPNMQAPIRVELWGDEIESIRIFDTLSQRSKAELNEIDFIDSMFVAENEKANSTIFDFINSDTIFIIDTPDAIDFTGKELAPIKNFRKIFLNPLGNFSDVN